jgi:WD40 repeat protein
MLFIGLSASFHPAHAQEIVQRSVASVLDIAFSPSANVIARVFANGRVEVISPGRNMELVNQLLPPQLSLQLWTAKLAWSMDGSHLAAGVGNTVYVWQVTPSAYSLLGEYVSGGNDALVYVDPSYIAEGFTSLQWDSSGRLLMSISVSSRLTIRSVETNDYIVDEIYGNTPMVWLPNNMTLSSGISGSLFHIATRSVELIQGNRIPRLADQCNIVTSLESNWSRTQLVAGTYTGCVNLFDALTNLELAGFKIADVPIIDASFSPDASQIVAIDAEGIVRIVDIKTGNSTVVAENDGALYAVDWSPTNSFIAYAGVNSAEAAVMQTLSVQAVEQMIDSRPAEPAPLAITPPPSAS